jgi:hypothetical protein
MPRASRRRGWPDRLPNHVLRDGLVLSFPIGEHKAFFAVAMAGIGRIEISSKQWTGTRDSGVIDGSVFRRKEPLQNRTALCQRVLCQAPGNVLERVCHGVGSVEEGGVSGIDHSIANQRIEVDDLLPILIVAKVFAYYAVASIM